MGIEVLLLWGGFTLGLPVCAVVGSGFCTEDDPALGAVEAAGGGPVERAVVEVVVVVVVVLADGSGTIR